MSIAFRIGFLPVSQSEQKSKTPVPAATPFPAPWQTLLIAYNSLSSHLASTSA